MKIFTVVGVRPKFVRASVVSRALGREVRDAKRLNGGGHASQKVMEEPIMARL